jgi:hypothetical protein
MRSTPAGPASRPPPRAATRCPPGVGEPAEDRPVRDTLAGPIIPKVSTTNPLADDSLADRLRALHEHYIDAVNRAVAAGRDDLVAELVADYPDEALALIAPSPIAQMPVGGRPVSTRCRCRIARWASALRAAVWW